MKNFGGLGFSFSAKDEASPAIDDLVQEIDRLLVVSDKLKSAMENSDKGGMQTFIDGQTRAVASTELLEDGLGFLGTSFWKLNKALFTGGGTLKLFTLGLLGSKKGAVALGGAIGAINFVKFAGGAAGGAKALDLLSKSLGQLRLSNFIQSVNSAKDSMSSFVGGVNQGLNLTTGYESRMLSMSKATSSLGANFGYVGAELKRFKKEAMSMAYGMEIGEEAAAKAIYAWDGAQEVFKTIGFDSAESLAKFSDVYGLGSDKMREMALNMQNQLGMTSEQIGTIFSSYVDMGKTTGDVSGALTEMGSMLETLSRRKALGSNAEEMTAFARETAAVGAALFEVNQDGAQATAVSQGLAKSLTEASGKMQDLFVGSGDGVGDFVEAFAQLGGDVNVATQLMQKGPAGLTEALQSIPLKELRQKNAKAYDYIRTKMESAFGDTKLANDYMMFLENSTDKTKALMKSVGESTVNVAKLGEDAYVSTISLADRWGKVQEQFEAGFRRIGKGAARQFVADTSKEFSKFTQVLSAVSADGGPFGQIVTKMSEMHSIGALALIPKTLRPMASLMGEMVTQATPMVGMLGSLGLRFSHLTNPVALATAGLVAFGAVVVSNRKGMEEQVSLLSKSSKAYDKESAALATMETRLDTLTEGTAERANLEAEVLKKKSGLSIAKSLSVEQKALEKNQKLLKKMGDKRGEAYDLLVANIERGELKIQALNKQTARAADEVTKASAKAMGLSVVEGIKTIVEMAPDLLASLWPMFKDVGVMFFGAVSNGVSYVLQRAVPLLKQLLGDVWSELRNLVDPNKGAKTSAGKIVNTVGTLGVLMAKELFFEAVSFVSDNAGPFFDQVTKLIGKGSRKLASFLPKLGSFVVSAASKLLSFAPVLFEKLFQGLKNINVVPLLKSAVDTLFNVLDGLLTKASADAVGSLIASIGKFVGEVYKELAAVVLHGLQRLSKVDFGAVLGVAQTVLSSYLGALQKIIAGVPWGALFSAAFATVGNLLSTLGSKATGDLFGRLAESYTSLLGELIQISLVAVKALVASLGTIDYAGVLSGIALNIVDTVEGAIRGLIPLVKAYIATVPSLFTGMFDGIVAFASDLGPMVRTFLTGLGERIREFLPELGPLLYDGFVAVWKFLLWDAPLTIVENLPAIFKTLYLTIPEVLWGLVTYFVDVSLGIVDAVLAALEKIPIIGRLFGWVREFAHYMFGIWDQIKTFVSGVFGSLGGAVDWVQEAFFDIGGHIQWLGDAFDKVVKAITAAWDFLFGHSIIPDWFAASFAFIGTVLDGFGRLFDTVVGAVTTVWGVFANVLTTLFNTWYTGVQFVAAGVLEALSYPVAILTTLWEGYLTYVETMFGALSSAVTWLGETVLQALYDPLGFIQMAWSSAGMLLSTIFDGLTLTVGWIQETVYAAFVDPVDILLIAWQGVESFFYNMFTILPEWVSGTIDSIIQDAQDLFGVVGDAAGFLWDTFDDLFGHSVNTIVKRDLDKAVGHTRAWADSSIGEAQRGYLGIEGEATRAFGSMATYGEESYSRLGRASRGFGAESTSMLGNLTQTAAGFLETLAASEGFTNLMGGTAGKAVEVASTILDDLNAKARAAAAEADRQGQISSTTTLRTDLKARKEALDQALDYQKQMASMDQAIKNPAAMRAAGFSEADIQAKQAALEAKARTAFEKAGVKATMVGDKAMTDKAAQALEADLRKAEDALYKLETGSPTATVAAPSERTARGSLETSKRVQYQAEILPPSPTLFEILQPDLEASAKQWGVWQTSLEVSVKSFASVTETIFSTMAVKVVSSVQTMWKSIGMETNMAVGLFLEGLSPLRDGVQELATTLENLAEAKSTLTREELVTVTPAATLREGENIQAEIFRATMTPDWYYRDYKSQVERLIAQVAAVNASVRSIPGPTSSSSKAKDKPKSSGTPPNNANLGYK